jgi:hypothetical protein
MERNIGIPTQYRGRHYRSRLEARWACFFDLVGWRFEYEPCDFDGWIPDFVLCEFHPVFIEVKPVLEFPADVAAKIDATACRQEVLILGMTLLRNAPPFHDEPPDLGWLRQGSEEGGCPEEEGGWWWERATCGVWTPRQGLPPRFGFCHSVGHFQDRITGYYDGGCCGGGDPRLKVDALLDLWAQAGNHTQWRKETL